MVISTRRAVGVRPGRPVENGYIESYNERLRDECLNVETFFDHSDVRDKLERWRQDYNQVRPHSALADRSPQEFARVWQQSSATSLRTAWPPNQMPSAAVQSSAAADPKPESFSPHPHPDVKGRSEKLLKDRTETVVQNSQLLKVVNQVCRVQ
jgi:putative transposase